MTANRYATVDREDALSRFFAQACDLFCLGDFNGCLTLLNPRWEEVLGWSEAEMRDTPWPQFVHSDDAAVAEAALQKARAGEAHVAFDVRFRHRDGGFRWLAWHASTARASQELFAVARDVTEERHAELLRREHETHLARAFRGTNDGIWDWDLVTDEVYLSPQFKALLGFAPDELPDHKDSFFKRLHPEDLPVAVLATERHLKDRVPYQIEVRLLTRSGEYRWFQSRGLAEWNTDGVAIRQSGCLSDIDDRKRAERHQRETEQRLQFALEAADIGDWNMDIRTNVAARSLQHDRCFGYQEQVANWGYETFLAHVHPSDRARVDTAFNRAMYGDGNYDVEFQVRWPDGSMHWLWSKGRFYFDDDNQPYRVAGIVADITERRHREALQKETEGIYTLLFDNNLDGIVQTTPEGDILAANPAALAMFGGEIGNLLRRRLVKKNDARLALFRKALVRHGSARGELALRRLNGVTFEADVACSLYHDMTGKPVLSFTIRDITERKLAEAEVHRLAFFDPLTGLSNRRLLLDRMAFVLTASRRSHKMSGVFFIDLDHFKNVNDARGHAVGDALLQQVAERIRSLLRENDSVARLGGDEFVVIGVDLAADLGAAAHAALVLAEKIRAALYEPFFIEGIPYRSSCSIGVTLMPKGDESADDLLREADTAMYRAKLGGRNRVEMFASSMHREALEQFVLETDLSLALSRNEVAMFIQPQYDNRGKAIAGELLMRWKHGSRGPIPPSVFIPVAEASGIILALGDWALEQGCLAIVRLAQAGRPLPLSINVSPRQFRQVDFVDKVIAVLTRTGAPGTSLILEVTESVLIDDVEASIAMMNALGAHGVQFSIDDFGTGYSCLSYIKRLPLHELKIDQSFVRDTPDDSDDTAIVQTIISMAKNFGMRVVAEGVETQRQADFLAGAGCDLMQGFLFQRPMPIAQWLAQPLSPP